MDFRLSKVDELKKYLKERGIQCSSHRKESLVRLAEAACDMNIPEIENDDEYRVSVVDRRTVTDSAGNTLVLPDVSTVIWDASLSALPQVEMGDIMVYLLNKCGWSSERLKTYKSDNAYQLYSCGHISDVKLCQTNSHMYVKGSCIPETRQAEKPYDSWVLLDRTGSIHSGGCTCVADDGSCKHCIALLFAIQNFCERHQDRNTEVGTDISCKWDRPRKRSEPALLQHIQYGKQEQSREIFTPNAEELEMKPQETLEKMVYKLCKGTNALFLQTVEPPDDDSESDSDNGELETFTNMLNGVKKQCGSNYQQILKELSDRHTSEYIANVEKCTEGQYENELWFNHRQGRITASIAHSVLKCKLEKLKPDNYIVRSIKGTTIPFSTEATDYGIKMEKVAYNMYVLKVKDTHKKFVHSTCGLFISKQFPFLAASPDGRVECSCCGSGLIEIKCSYTYRHKTPLEVACDNNYYLYAQDGKVKLKENTSWYTQIQTQLGVCELSYCDFVFLHLKASLWIGFILMLISLQKSKKNLVCLFKNIYCKH